MEATGIPATTYLSIFGIVVLLICLALTFTGRATPLRAPQKIKGFGVELEISVLTLLVLIGFCLSISGTTRFFRIAFRREISCNASSPPVSYNSLNR